MTEKDTRVRIKNRSGVTEVGRSYMCYFADQRVKSSRNLPLDPTIFYSSKRSTRDGGSQEFTIRPALFGLLCYCQDQNNIEIKHGSRVTVTYERTVRLGDKGNDGTSLHVRKGDDGEISFQGPDALKGRAPINTFEILCDANLPDTNNYAVGIGRMVEREVVPVAIVRCVPNTTFVFTPSHRFYTVLKPDSDPNEAGSDYKTGTVVSHAKLNPSDRTPALAEIDGTGNLIEISEDEPGVFYVNAPARRPARPANHFAHTSTANDTPRASASASSSRPTGAPTASTAEGIPTTEEFHKLISQVFPDYRPKRESDDDDDDDEDLGDDGFHLDRLKQWDIVFVVDDTGTMRLPTKGHWDYMPKNYTGQNRWGLVCDALLYLADAAASRDEDGVDLYFLINKKLGKKKLKTGQLVLNQLEKNIVKKNHGGTYFEPTLRPIITRYLNKLKASLSNNDENAEDIRPLDILVLTDGAALDKDNTKDLLVDTVVQLKDMGASTSQIGIQFVQVGEDKEAKKWLDRLNMAVKFASPTGFDIVDTVAYTELDHDKISFGKKLVRILVGGMDSAQRVKDDDQRSTRSL